MGKKVMTAEEVRKATIKEYQKKIDTLKAEAKQKAQIKAEKEQLKQLQRELHPSKFQKLAGIIGKVEHGGTEVGKAFLKAGKEAHKAQQAYEKSKGR